jgi:ketosteroid isomerase-like protein
MKRTNLLSASLLIAILFTATEGFSQSNSEYKAKIETLTRDMAKWMVEGNSEKTLSLYTPDAISMPSYQPMQDGIAAIRSANEAMASSGMKYNSFELTTLKVMVNGNMINEIGTYKLNVSVPGMEKPVDDHGKYLTVWEKQKDGSLKIKIETWNSDVDPMAMMSQMGQKDTGK